MSFVRKMKAALKLECEDTQVKNGFDRLIKNYTDVKTKLNASGFGVDPEKDRTLNLESGWFKNTLLQTHCNTTILYRVDRKAVSVFRCVR